MLPYTNVNKSPKAQVHKWVNVWKLAQIKCLSRNHLKWRMWLSAVWVCSLLLPVTCETSCGTRGLMSNVHVCDRGITTSVTMRETKIVLWQSKKTLLFFFLLQTRTPWPMFYLSIKSSSERTEFPPEWPTIWLSRIFSGIWRCAMICYCKVFHRYMLTVLVTLL